MQQGDPVPLLWNVMATGCLGFERHGGDPSVRKGAVVLHRPAPDANRPDPCNKVGATSNFAAIGVPNVVFDSVITHNSTGVVGGCDLVTNTPIAVPAGSATILGSTFQIDVTAAL